MTRNKKDIHLKRKRFYVIEGCFLFASMRVKSNVHRNFRINSNFVNVSAFLKNVWDSNLKSFSSLKKLLIKIIYCYCHYYYWIIIIQIICLITALYRMASSNTKLTHMRTNPHFCHSNYVLCKCKFPILQIESIEFISFLLSQPLH